MLSSHGASKQYKDSVEPEPVRYGITNKKEEEHELPEGVDLPNGVKVLHKSLKAAEATQKTGKSTVRAMIRDVVKSARTYKESNEGDMTELGAAVDEFEGAQKESVRKFIITVRGYTSLNIGQPVPRTKLPVDEYVPKYIHVINAYGFDDTDKAKIAAMTLPKQRQVILAVKKFKTTGRKLPLKKLLEEYRSSKATKAPKASKGAAKKQKAKLDEPGFIPTTSDSPSDEQRKLVALYNFCASAATSGNHVAMNTAFMGFFPGNVPTTMDLVETINALWDACPDALARASVNNASVKIDATEPLKRGLSLACMISATYKIRASKDVKPKSVTQSDLSRPPSSATNATVMIPVAGAAKTPEMAKHNSKAKELSEKADAAEQISPSDVAVLSNTGADGAPCNQFSDMVGMDAAEGSGKGPQLPDQAAFGSPWTDQGDVEMGGVNAAEVIGTMALDGGAVDAAGGLGTVGLDDGAVDAAEGLGTTVPDDGAAQGRTTTKPAQDRQGGKKSKRAPDQQGRSVGKRLRSTTTDP